MPKEALENDLLLSELVMADVEERHERNLPVTLEHYLSALPNVSLSSALIVMLLAEELRNLCATGMHRTTVLDQLRQRYGKTFPKEVEAVGLSGSIFLPPPPREIGKYQLKELLGAGGFGEVYRAWDVEMGRYLALKLLAPSKNPEKLLAKLQGEVRAASCLDHPNVVHINTAGRVPTQATQDWYFIDMVLCAPTPRPCFPAIYDHNWHTILPRSDSLSMIANYPQVHNA